MPAGAWESVDGGSRKWFPEQYQDNDCSVQKESSATGSAAQFGPGSGWTIGHQYRSSAEWLELPSRQSPGCGSHPAHPSGRLMHPHAKAAIPVSADIRFSWLAVTPDPQLQLTEHPYGTALPALEITRGQSLACAGLISRAQAGSNRNDTTLVVSSGRPRRPSGGRAAG
jgi:hypothetical protein